MPSQEMMVSMILRRPWQRQHQAHIDWDTNEVRFRHEDGYLSQPFVPQTKPIAMYANNQTRVVEEKTFNKGG